MTMRYRLKRLLVRFLVIAIIVSVITVIPIEWSWWLSQSQIGAAALAFLLVCTLGALLYDTLFYDHYRP